MAKTSGLIKIKKGDEELEINPKTWPQHKALGWELVDPESVDEEPAAAEPKPAASRTRIRTRKGKAGKAESAPEASEEE